MYETWLVLISLEDISRKGAKRAKRAKRCRVSEDCLCALCAFAGNIQKEP
jgi:hypothetical protein